MEVDAVIDSREHAIENRSGQPRRQSSILVPRTNTIHIHRAAGFERPASLPTRKRRWVGDGDGYERAPQIANANLRRNAPGRFDTDQLVAVESTLDIEDRTGPGSTGYDDR
jgi:hypothetical protein